MLANTETRQEHWSSYYKLITVPLVQLFVIVHVRKISTLARIVKDGEYKSIERQIITVNGVDLEIKFMFLMGQVCFAVVTMFINAAFLELLMDKTLQEFLIDCLSYLGFHDGTFIRLVQNASHKECLIKNLYFVCKVSFTFITLYLLQDINRLRAAIQI